MASAGRESQYLFSLSLESKNRYSEMDVLLITGLAADRRALGDETH
jgi:hypothetical protein